VQATENDAESNSSAFHCFTHFSTQFPVYTKGLYVALASIKVKVPPNRLESPEEGRGIALLFLDLDTRRGGWSAPRPGRFTP
jgi:hypothetical protein